MRIAVNTRLLLKDKLEGIGWYSYETLKRITQQHKDVSFYFIFDRMYDEDFIFSDNITPIIQAPQARHPVLFYLWFEQALPPLLKKINADLFLSPDGYLSLKTKTKSIAVIHDLNFEHYPEDFPWMVRRYYRYYFPRFAKKATRIVTVSEFSKSDIIAKYGINPELIDISCNGMNERYAPLGEKEQIEIRTKYTSGEDYFIFIGALIPRKNVSNLFLAFDIFKSRTRSRLKLVIVGEKKWWTKSMQQHFQNMKYRDDVIFLGRQQVDTLRELLASALALTYVSYFEGFGIPILEAFACKTPVITANITSMPEIAADAALLCYPFNPESIAEAMIKIYKDEDLRNDLIEKGSVRKDAYSWQIGSEQLWKSVEKTIQM